MIGHPAIYAAQALASGLAVALAARSRRHLPLALLIPFGLACDVALELVGPAPEGWRFGAGVVLGTAYPWAVLAAVAVVLAPRLARERLGTRGAGDGLGDQPPGTARRPRNVTVPGVSPHPGGDGLPRPVFLAGSDGIFDDQTHAPHRAPAPRPWQALAGWLVLLATIFALSLRGPALARTYAAAQAVVAVALAVAVVRWRRLQEPRTATATCAIICAAAECANVPAYLGLPSWFGARSVYAMTYALLILVQARALMQRVAKTGDGQRRPR